MLDLLTRTGKSLHGEQWQRPIAVDLGVNERTVRRWVARASPVPDGIRAELLALVKAHGRRLADLADELA